MWNGHASYGGLRDVLIKQRAAAVSGKGLVPSEWAKLRWSPPRTQAINSRSEKRTSHLLVIIANEPKKAP